MTATLTLSSASLEELKTYLPRTVEALRQYLAIETADFASGGEARSAARQAAEALDGRVLTSDTDAPYWPCVLTGLGADPWQALGIAPDEVVTLSGWKNPRLEQRKVPAVQALANLSDSNFDDVGEYVVEEDQEHLAEVGAGLEKHGPLLNLRLAFPEESAKLIFVVAPVNGELAGVMSLAVET